MIKKEIITLLNQQINAELWSAYLYLSMSLDAAHKGQEGVANWFMIQSQEEVDHSRIIQKYMISQECKVTLMPMDKVPASWDSPQSMFEAALSHEQKVTEMIRNIVTIAEREKDYATLSQMGWFIDEQVEEENSCNAILQKYRSASDNTSTQFLIDNELKSRKYRRTRHTYTENWLP